MPVTQVIRYEFDATGASPDNYIAKEDRILLLNRKRRVIAPYCSPYYVESMQIKDPTTNTYLTRGVDWYPADFHEFASTYTGKEIASIIVITNEKIGKNVSLSYQTVGGPFANNADVVAKQIEALDLDNRPIHFDKILNKPHAYPPAPHLHSIGDIYGFEYITTALERIRQAIISGDWQNWANIYKYIDDEIAKIKLTGGDNGALDELRKHLRDYDNPHRTTAEQVGAYDKTTTDTKIDKVKSDLEKLLNQAIQKVQAVEDGLSRHIKDTNNPHKTTIKQLGGLTEEEIRNLLKNHYTKKEVDDLLKAFTPGAPDLSALTNHLKDFNNPHRVTAVQVGTYPKTELYNKVEVDAKFGKIVDLRDPKTNKIRNIYIPISKVKDNTVQLLDDGLYVGDQSDKKYAVVHVDAINGKDNDDDPEAGTEAKPYKSLGYALSLGMPNTKREIRLKEGQTHYISLPHGGSFGDKTMVELRGGIVDILPYGPQSAAITDPPMQSKFKRIAMRQLNTKLVFRGVEIWGSGNNLLRMNALSITRKGTMRFWGLTIMNQIPEMCYTFNTTQYSMTPYLGRLDYNSDGFIELHNCALDTGGKNIDQAIPGISSRKTKDYTLFLSTRDTPSISIFFEGSIADDGRTWDRELKIVGNNKCFDFYSKHTAKVIIDNPTSQNTDIFVKYFRLSGNATYPAVWLGSFYNVETNILPSTEKIKESLAPYVS